ncbi:MAG: ribonuclease H-like domain-containing protein [Chloroflexota bacterium]|nr:ribonuclease H-like domain-containing protein [Chloroflexota bacterium]MDE2683511.1 ribonuclease H-like domain-containing protein [Chloroflexota bacterium]
MDAYLDIETTGFIGGRSYPTVVGIAVDFPGDWSVEQLVGDDITPSAIRHVLEGVTTIYTFNGSSFDLPFLAWKPGVDLRRRFQHHDLMHTCRRAGLRGGLKRIERALGIERTDLPEMDGHDAVLLWRKYRQEASTAALDLLLEYNRADVENLRTLRNLLEESQDRRT